MNPTIPHISMSEFVRYTTQASAYDRLLMGGELTNRKLRTYILAGRYGKAPQRRMQEAVALKTQRALVKRLQNAPRQTARKRIIFEYDL